MAEETGGPSHLVPRDEGQVLVLETQHRGVLGVHLDHPTRPACPNWFDPGDGMCRKGISKQDTQTVGCSMVCFNDISSRSSVSSW